MKKVSTAVAKQIRIFSESKLTIGLDLGDRSSWYCVLGETGTKAGHNSESHERGVGRKAVFLARRRKSADANRPASYF
jgi:hypothetical protein